MSVLIGGGCLCGEMRYQLSGSPRHGSICYCLDCRRASAAPGVAWVSVRREDFLLLSGQVKQVQHAGRLRSFATCCGTPILVQDAVDSQWVDVATCSMDSRNCILQRPLSGLRIVCPGFQLLARFPSFDATDKTPNQAMQRTPIWRWTPEGQAKDRYNELLYCEFNVDRSNTQQGIIPWLPPW
jgi:hypothetical protein